MQPLQQLLLDLQLIARTAGGLLLDHHQVRAPLEVTTKRTAMDLVTELDVLCERLIAAELAKRYPGVPYVGEELSAGTIPEGPCFVVDPLDGTTNFVHGHPSFCVSLAYCEHGVPKVGVVFAPALGELYAAAEGLGSELNGRPLRVSACSSLSTALLGTGFACIRSYPTYRGSLDFLSTLLAGTHGFRRAGSAALDLCFVAAGRLDCFWEQCLSSWDIAAGTLLVREAGGLVSDFQGCSDLLQSNTIVAAPPSLHAELLARLAGLVLADDSVRT
ncbi:MAG: hypothetical protein A2284_16430 [Deltaproteobacteria bacterium RIFOXYA12_FULL_61_11]|nr:MAG: hypothetical protein A2284_16430 [Deltaproteobacteria bacterium RIFOXYA12_FULL_61_11]